MSGVVYLYIDIEGKIGKSDDAPTEVDIASVADGQLTVLQITSSDYGIFVEEYDPSIEDDDKWCDVQAAIKDTDDYGNGFHWS